MWMILLIIATIGLWFWMMREQRSAEEAAEDALDLAESVKKKVEIKSTPEPDAKQEVTPIPTRPVPPAAPAPVPVPTVVEPDDLTRIEGIGPKMADILVAAGIDSYAKLAAMSDAAIEETVKAGGGRKSASMGTWAAQAKLAAKGDWDALAKYQTKLKK
jgi:small subunit ribosomal protein S2